MQKIIFLLFCVVVPNCLIAQILPKENSSLNFRLIGFSFPKYPKANNYSIEIALGSCENTDLFEKNKICTYTDTNNQTIEEVPYFGSYYTWRVVYKKHTKIIGKSALYHFGTKTCTRVDSTVKRLRILQPADTKYKNYLVSVNNGGVLYDMTGKPVWYIPDTNGVGGNVADLKFTKDGTVTFLYAFPYEIDLIGNVLWQPPHTEMIGKDISTIRYHHELTKLSNGNYMVMGTQFLMCKEDSINDQKHIAYLEKIEIREGYKRGKYGTLIEYDDEGRVVWKWKSSKYLMYNDFLYFSPKDTNIRFDPHDNSFFFDEKNSIIYLSYRNLNRIMKIEYPSGKVIATYGDNFKPGQGGVGEGLFCNPHSIKLSPNGYLYYFENNSCNNTDSLPTVVILKEPVTEKDSLKKIWEYTCYVEPGYPLKYQSGGNVIELPDSAIYVCIGSDFSKQFIVNRNKQIMWSGLHEIYYPSEHKWNTQKQDRSTIITRKEFEKCVWNAESK